MARVEQIMFVPTFAGWQQAARRALAADLAPETVIWEELGADQPSLGMFNEMGEGDTVVPVARYRVPRAFIAMAERVACHSDPRRWALLYRVLWRLTHGEAHLLEIISDRDVHELQQLDKAVRHEIHKMRAFVRFRAVSHGEDTWYVAWFEPAHHVVERNAAFFRDRFAGMKWSILTPARCVHWNGTELTFTEGVQKSEAPTEDAMEELWRTYYGHIFNPARVKTAAMQAEMPKRYWKNLPEAQIIPTLLQEAPARVERMISESDARVIREKDYSIARPPQTEDWAVLQDAAASCRACPLWKNATQTVFGEGPWTAEIVLLGEQPGDSEDRVGKPFVGPAGELLNRALAEAGIARDAVYVTNVVKHFKWEPRGKQRLHQKPSARDVAACRPWAEAELRLIKPRILICLGSTAAIAVFGSEVRILRDRGRVRPSEFAPQTVITYHPSALLRAPDEATRARQYAEFVSDLRLAIEK